MDVSWHVDPTDPPAGIVARALRSKAVRLVAIGTPDRGTVVSHRDRHLVALASDQESGRPPRDRHEHRHVLPSIGRTGLRRLLPGHGPPRHLPSPPGVGARLAIDAAGSPRRTPPRRTPIQVTVRAKR